MSNRRAQDERIEGTPDGVNAISEIVDVPNAPTIGTATAGFSSASVAFTPATTGGTVSLFTATSSPGSITGTSATSPITVSGLTVGTEYTFTVSGENSTGTSPLSSASNSVFPIELEGSYDALSTVTLSSATSSVTFAGIPSGYKHLQIRASAQCNRATYGTDDLNITFNSDTTTNYGYHRLFGDGATAQAGAASSTAFMQVLSGAGTGNGSTFASSIIDILDYANTNKYKTMRTLSGDDLNGLVAGYGGYAVLSSGLWRSTSAITSVSIVINTGASFTEYSSFALYGVK
jgi:hypothetical protein